MEVDVMEIKFDNLEELIKKFPIDGKHNFKYHLEEYHIFCPTPRDVEKAKEQHPNGYFNKAECNYYYCIIRPVAWYDYYLFDGTYWYLGFDDWEGINKVLEEPKYRALEKYNGAFFGTFRTEEEAYECVKKRYSKEEVCKF